MGTRGRMSSQCLTHDIPIKGPISTALGRELAPIRSDLNSINIETEARSRSPSSEVSTASGLLHALLVERAADFGFNDVSRTQFGS